MRPSCMHVSPERTRAWAPGLLPMAAAGLADSWGNVREVLVQRIVPRGWGERQGGAGEAFLAGRRQHFWQSSGDA